MGHYLVIGCTPPEEDCYPAGHPLAYKETLVYLRQLRREFPQGNFRVKAFPHDFGTYHEVVALLGEENDAAYAAEATCSPKWDTEALGELARLRKEEL